MFLPPANFEKCNLQHAKRKMKLQFQIEVLWLAQIYKLHPRIFRVSLKYCLSTCQKFGNLPNLLPMLSQSTKASIRATWTYLSLCKTDLHNQQCANTHEDNFASHKRIMYHCQHPIFSSHCCAIFGRFNKVLVVVMLVVCLQTCGEYIVYNDTQLTLQGLRKHANMLVRPRLTTSRLLCLLLGSAQLATLLHATTGSALWWQESYFCHEALCQCLSS